MKERLNLSIRDIVIVDDDASVLGALDALLKAWGYRVVAFGSFEDARAFLMTYAPDALIADIRLGMFNGLQLVYIARELRPDMRAMIVSGIDDSDLRAEAARAGAVYLVKPLQADQLRQWLANGSSASRVEGEHTRQVS